MNPSFERLNSFWHDQSDTFVENLCDDIVAGAGPSYLDMPREQLRESVQQFVQTWQTCLETGDPTSMLDLSRKVGLQRSVSHVGIDEIMRVVDYQREHVWRMMSQVYTSGDWDMDVVEQVERWLHAQRSAVMSGYSHTFQEASDRLAERERALEDQGRLIQELSAPIVPIHEGILVLPLVGALDSRRAAQIMESALEKIVAYQADVLILDITGVPIVDTGVANYILQMARAVTLLGSKVVLVGIGAEIAQTIVQLGVDLRDMTTLANLQAGIAYALAQQGFAITSASPAGRRAEVV
jgi:rsbT co-antagonist protein RsbR